MYKKYITWLAAIGFSGVMSAQNINQAKQLFLNGEYSKAKPTFEYYQKKSPSNANYNYWYGVCLYKEGSVEKSIPYIKKGATAKILNAYKFLGEAYYDIYHFDEAEEYYSQYITALEKEKHPINDAEQTLEKIQRSSRMIKGVENVTVVDSFVVDKKSFLKAYKINNESGDIDQNSDNSGTTYTTENGTNRILSQPAENGKYQLYSSIKMINGWSAPSEISSLNGNFDVNYPYLMSDGVTLYYASNNNNSLGGYDIFVTRYDSDDSKYLRPDNIGMPFNSPFNDYMFVIDEMNNLGWFASDRYQPEGKVCIYIFVPNKTKIVYDYESTPLNTIISAATLRPLSASQKDKAKIAKAKQVLLATVSANKIAAKKEKDFTFIINDDAVYHSFNDFHSTKAQNLYVQLTQKQSDYSSLINQLNKKRDTYLNSNDDEKKALTPAILDLEKRTEQMKREVDSLTIKVRNEEITKIKR